MARRLAMYSRSWPTGEAGQGIPKRRSMWARTCVPSPKRNRPPEASARSHAVCARTVGLRAKLMATAVPNCSRRVCSATRAKGRNGSCCVSLDQTAVKSQGFGGRGARGNLLQRSRGQAGVDEHGSVLSHSGQWPANFQAPLRVNRIEAEMSTGYTSRDHRSDATPRRAFPRMPGWPSANPLESQSILPGGNRRQPTRCGLWPAPFRWTNRGRHSPASGFCSQTRHSRGHLDRLPVDDGRQVAAGGFGENDADRIEIDSIPQTEVLEVTRPRRIRGR